MFLVTFLNVTIRVLEIELLNTSKYHLNNILNEKHDICVKIVISEKQNIINIFVKAIRSSLRSESKCYSYCFNLQNISSIKPFSYLFYYLFILKILQIHIV